MTKPAVAYHLPPNTEAPHAAPQLSVIPKGAVIYRGLVTPGPGWRCLQEPRSENYEYTQGVWVFDWELMQQRDNGHTARTWAALNRWRNPSPV